MRRFAVALAVAPLALASPARAQDDHSHVVEEEEPAAPAPEAPAAVAAAAEPSIVHFELLARGGYMAPAVRGGITPFGLGAGGGLGLSVGPVYVGASIIAYAGGSDGTGSAEHSLLYGVETGYELHLTPAFTLRPFVGVGGATITHSLPTSSSSTSGPVAVGSRAPDVITQATSVSSGGGGGSGGAGPSSNDVQVNTFYFEPGVVAMLAAQSGVFVGLRASLLYFPSVAYGADASTSYLPYALHLTVGQRW